VLRALFVDLNSLCMNPRKNEMRAKEGFDKYLLAFHALHGPKLTLYDALPLTVGLCIFYKAAEFTVLPSEREEIGSSEFTELQLINYLKQDITKLIPI